MNRFARTLSLAACCAVAARAGPLAAATQTAAVKANVLKPLTLSSLQDLDLGTITLNAGTWATTTVGISRAGAFACGANVVCTGAVQVARYRVTGSNNQVVTISAPDVTMVNQSDSTKTLTLVVDSPGEVTLTSSGFPGVIFPLGGTITLSSATASGDYKGTFDVTVDYQ